jgi:glycosyltransferase involved in cell wall biosynthesis
MKKIAFYIPLLNIGGAERVIIDILNQVSNKSSSDKFYLIVDKNKSQLIEQLSKKINILHLDSKHGIIYRVYKIHNILQKNEIKMIFAHLTHANLHVLLSRLIFNYRDIKVVVTEHSILTEYINSIKSFKHFVIKQMITFLYNRSDCIICVSNSVKNDLINSWNINSETVIRIYNPINTDNIDFLLKERVEKEISLICANKKVIISIGRLEVQKNHILLLKSISLLKEEYENFVLIIIGDGNQKNNLLEYIKINNLEKYIKLIGYNTNPYKYLKLADLFVLPSFFEGFGIVLVEAMYLNKKIVSTATEASKEILEDSRYGTVCNNTPLEMARSIFDNLVSEVKPTLLSEKAREFNVDKIGGEYLRLISNFLK